VGCFASLQSSNCKADYFVESLTPTQCKSIVLNVYDYVVVSNLNCMEAIDCGGSNYSYLSSNNLMTNEFCFYICYSNGFKFSATQK